MKSQQQRYGPEVYRRRAAGESWETIYPDYPDISPSTLRKMAHRERAARGELSASGQPPAPAITGVALAEELDEDAIIAELIRQSQIRKRREQIRRSYQSIEFDHGPVALTLLADIHAGSTGTDYARLIRDLELIRSTPGMYLGLVGDYLDNFIIGRLRQLLLGRDISIGAEWVVVKRVLTLAAPALLFLLSGNHDLWTYLLTGVDYLREVAREIRPDAIYDQHDATIAIRVGEAEFLLRARHKWKGTSIYNDTHGIEAAAKWDKGRHFDIGVGAHTHASGLYREFNNGGRTGAAILCGSYKRFDEFAEQEGFRQPNEATAVTVILDERGMMGTNNLEMAAAYMRAVYGAKSAE